MTLGEIKKAAMALIEEYSDTAATNYTSDEDISRKINPVIDAVQHELATIKKIRKSIKVSNYLPQNLCVVRGVFAHNDEDVKQIAKKGRSYCFMIDNNAEITVKVGNTVVDTITHTATKANEYEAVKGLISNAENKPVEIIFGGDYYYTVKNFAIYAANFASAESVPLFSDYAEFDLPSAFYQLESVRLRNGESVNALPSELEIKDKNTLLLHAEATGEYEVKYFAYPASITAASSDDTELEIDEDVQRLIMYAVAADVLKTDPSVDYSAFEKKYKDKLNMLDPRNNLSKTVSIHKLVSGGHLL
jgi:hypothetical protein